MTMKFGVNELESMLLYRVVQNVFRHLWPYRLGTF